MKVTVLCSSKEHPIYPILERWASERSPLNSIRLINQAKEAGEGDILFLIACNEIVRKEIRSGFRHTLVVHASALPKGRGWSPYIWNILEGANEIPVTLLEAEDSVDTGAIWRQTKFVLEGHELYEEICSKLFEATVDLMDFALENSESIRPQPQAAESATYYRKRTPEDSRLDLDRSIRDQFNLLRVADSTRYPCFFEINGIRYELTIRKSSR